MLKRAAAIMSSGHSDPSVPRTDYLHNEMKFQKEVAAAIDQSSTLDDAIRRLYAQGYGKLFICQGLVGRSSEDPEVTKLRVIRVINELIAEQQKTIKDRSAS